jgi:adenine-specific DNA-methyltransferase
MAVKRALLDFVDQYIEVIDGHPNLFQLFLWWAVNAVAPGGIISFLLPQSLLAAYYFRRLRNKLAVSTKLLRVTRILDHKGLFGDADQQMMAACFQVAQEKARPGTVEIRVTENGSGLATRKPYNARYSRVVQNAKEQDAIWIVSDNVLDYTICERLEDNCIPLSELALTYELGNGGYVWNQNKELVQQEEAEGSWPLLSAASIRPYAVDFPYLGSHASRTRQFSLLNDKVRGLAYSGPALLIQRTTPRKVGRRLVAGVPPETFFARYPHYFLENHVNHIRVREGVETELLYGLMVWLNSDLMNFSFHLRNGTAQVSLYELGMLPVNLTVVREVADQGLKIARSDPKMQESLAEAIDDDLYDWLGLGVRHRRRVARVLRLRAGNSAS